MALTEPRTHKGSRISFAVPDFLCDTIAQYSGEILAQNGFRLCQISFCPSNIEVPSIVYDSHTRSLKVTLLSTDNLTELSRLLKETGSKLSAAVREIQIQQLAIVVLIFLQDVTPIKSLLQDIGTKYNTLQQLFDLDIIRSDDFVMIFEHLLHLNFPVF